MRVLSDSVIPDFHTSQIDLNHCTEKLKVCVFFSSKLTLCFVAGSVDVMHSVARPQEPSTDGLVFKQQEQALSAERLANTSERKLYVQ